MSASAARGLGRRWLVGVPPGPRPRSADGGGGAAARPRARVRRAGRRRPRCRRARCPGCLTAWTAAVAIGSTPSPRNASGCGLVARGPGRARPASRAAAPRPASGSRRPTGGTGRGRTAARARPRTPGPRIEPSETVRPPSSTTAIVWAAASRRDQVAGDLLERRRDRLDRAEVGAGADHDRDAGLAQPAYRLGEVAHRVRGQHRVGDVVGADQDHRDVGLDRQGPVDLAGEVGGLGADHRRTRAGGPGGRPARPGRWPAARRASPRPGRRRTRRRWSRRAARP